MSVQLITILVPHRPDFGVSHRFSALRSGHFAARHRKLGSLTGGKHQEAIS